MTTTRINHDRDNECYEIAASIREGRNIPPIRYDYASEEARILGQESFDFKRYGAERELAQYVAEGDTDEETAARIIEADRVRTLRNHRMDRATR